MAGTLKSCTISCQDPDLLCTKLSELFDLCRQYGCINACWTVKFGPDTDEKDFEIVKIDRSMVQICCKKSENFSFKIPTLFGTQPPYHYQTSPCENSALFDEIFANIHHIYFNPCSLRSDKGTSILSRIDRLEAYVEDLKTLIQTTDEVESESKKRKIKDV